MKTISINVPLLRSLLALATVIEARDLYTGGHTWRVSQYARRLAETAGLPPDEVFITYLGGMVHDIGKVGIPDQVLNKKGKLTDVEYEIIKKHSVVGQALVRDHPLSMIILDIVLAHHERYDGQGYPNRLGGKEISTRSRIVTIADAFDAMTSVRCYRPAMPPETAYDILLAESGQQFDPALARVFVDMGTKGELEHLLGHCGEGRLMMQCLVCGPTITTPKGARGGDYTFCPVCTGKYVIETMEGELQVEWTGLCEATLVPQPDIDTIEEFVSHTPAEVKVPA